MTTHDELAAPEGHQDCIEAIADEVDEQILFVEKEGDLEDIVTRWITADPSDLLDLEDCR